MLERMLEIKGTLQIDLELAKTAGSSESLTALVFQFSGAEGASVLTTVLPARQNLSYHR